MHCFCTYFKNCSSFTRKFKDWHVSSINTCVTYLLTPWCRVLLEKLIGLQLVKNSTHIVEPIGSLLHSQAPAICPSHKCLCYKMYNFFYCRKVLCVHFVCLLYEQWKVKAYFQNIYWHWSLGRLSFSIIEWLKNYRIFFWLLFAGFSLLISFILQDYKIHMDMEIANTVQKSNKILT